MEEGAVFKDFGIASAFGCWRWWRAKQVAGATLRSAEAVCTRASLQRGLYAVVQHAVEAMARHDRCSSTRLVEQREQSRQHADVLHEETQAHRSTVSPIDRRFRPSLDGFAKGLRRFRHPTLSDSESAKPSGPGRKGVSDYGFQEIENRGLKFLEISVKF